MEEVAGNAVSAPGKVLFAGGYLILDRQHTGLVLGIDARIHVHVRSLVPQIEGVVLREIVVKSPQFRDAVWRYGYHSDPRQGGGVKLVQLTTGLSQHTPANPFVETALSYALTYISTFLEAPMDITPSEITILADSSYYSSSQLVLPLRSGSRFQKFNTTIWDAHKTGLGSSAALVTALTGAVLRHYLTKSQIAIDTDHGKKRVHNLAQVAHCAAQGKIGSGFDVASAVYGSCIYRRFSPRLLEGIGELGTVGFARTVRALVDEMQPMMQWDTEIHKGNITIPKGIRLVMCDVNCGSNTPGMVKKVLEWRKENPQDADRIWAALQTNNNELAAELVRLATAGGGTEYGVLKEKIQRLRALVREMSDLSGVEIEPRPQTELLDGYSRIPGVIGGVTPGAGGFDAVSLLIEDKADVVAEFQKLTNSWKFKIGDGDTSEGGKVAMLNIREELEGLKEERQENYTAWLTQ